MIEYLVEVAETETCWYHAQTKKFHRLGDLPAVSRNDGYEAYYQYGLRHRGNGMPAVIRADGSVEYWLNGSPYFPDRCEHKVIEIDGKKFKLVPIQDK